MSSGGPVSVFLSGWLNEKCRLLICGRTDIFFISSLEIYIFRLEMHVFSLKIHILRLGIEYIPRMFSFPLSSSWGSLEEEGQIKRGPGDGGRIFAPCSLCGLLGKYW